MPVIAGRHDNSDVFLDVGIIDADVIDPNSAQQFTPIAAPAMFRALIDTGAQQTMISSNVIQALNLTPRGRILISGVGPTANYHDGYLFHVAFVAPIVPAGGITGQGRAVAAPVPIERHASAAPRRSLLPLAGAGRGLWGKASTRTLRKLREERNR
jgi:hypothetical protein